METTTFWLSYDLGLRGDYNSLYTWLDKHQAKEAGDSVAFFKLETKTDNPLEEVKKELKKAVKFEKTNRVYLVCMNNKTQSFQAGFVIGNRKRSPWEGYYSEETESNIDC